MEIYTEETTKSRELKGLGPRVAPINTRAGGLPSSSEKKVLNQAMAWLQSTLATRDAALAIAATLWGLAQREAHSTTTGAAIRWAQSAASRLGVVLTEPQAEKILFQVNPIGEGLLHRVGHFIDALLPHLYPEDKHTQSGARKRSGTYITPYPIARLMVERAFQATEERLPLVC